MKNRKFSFFIFDLDGVILNSNSNMNKSWTKTSKDFGLNIKFSSYKKFIGLPFKIILKKLKVKDKFLEIEKYYKDQSIKNSNNLKLFSGVKKTLHILKKKKIQFSIVTSKDLERSKKILKRFKINPSSLHCPNAHFRGKPYADHLNHAIKKNKFNKQLTCYVGDTHVDYLSSKNARIDFIFVTYGFGKKKNIYRNKINNFFGLLRYI